MSSGATGGSTRSRRPARTARSSAAHSTSSSRVVGNRRPFGVARRAWPERPTRWRKVAMLRGEPIWQTSSTGPMSMPSSSDAVATSTVRSPARSRSSTRSAPLLREAAVVRGDASLAERLAELVRDALGQPPRVDEHQRGAVLATRARDARRGSRPTARRSATASSSLLGTSIARSSARRWPSSTIAQAGVPSARDAPGPSPDQQPRQRLDRALRRRQADARRRLARTARRAARARARGASRACRARRAWISSTITRCTRAQRSRLFSAVSSR